MAEQQHVYTHPSRVEHWRHVVEIVALSAAAVWAFYVFVYQEQLKPAHLSPVLEVTSRVYHAPMRGGNELITVEMLERNIGGVKLQIDAAIVNVYGLRYGAHMTKWPDRDNALETYALPIASSTLLLTQLKIYRPMGGGSWSSFGVGREKTPSVSIAVPSGAFDAVRVGYGVCYQREDDAKRHVFHATRRGDGSYDVAPLADLESAVRDVQPFCPSGTAIVAI